MKVNKFAKAVTKAEGKKVEVNIAQVGEVLKVANKLLNGRLYVLIRETVD